MSGNLEEAKIVNPFHHGINAMMFEDANEGIGWHTLNVSRGRKALHCAVVHVNVAMPHRCYISFVTRAQWRVPVCPNDVKGSALHSRWAF